MGYRHHCIDAHAIIAAAETIAPGAQSAISGWFDRAIRVMSGTYQLDRDCRAEHWSRPSTSSRAAKDGSLIAVPSHRYRDDLSEERY
jgi:hypothetical protein